MIHRYFPRVGREARSCSAVTRFGMLVPGLAALLIVFCGGCRTQDDAAPKASHFEHDHEIAAHWPNDLADVADKIRKRLAWMDTGEVPVMEPVMEQDHDAHDHHRHDHHDAHEGEESVQTFEPVPEIVDLVSWVPEIAADTNLPEVDWLPLYQKSESLKKKLRDATEQVIRDNRTEIESLCQLIDEASSQISENLPGIGANLL
jgi:hypothetical protein